jgi:hypothetical protein
MAATQEAATLRQRACRGCHSVFFICPSCDRGHRYCSLSCREQVRRQQCRSANDRHQRSLEGRLDHRDRQRKYRERRHALLSPVTDQASFSITSPASSECRSGKAAENPLSPQFQPGRQVSVWLRCRICGCRGRFIDPFPRIPRQR